MLNYLRKKGNQELSLRYHLLGRGWLYILLGLDSINGIGENTKNKLLKKFKSISKLKKADKKEIIDLIGKSKTEKVMNYLKESI